MRIVRIGILKTVVPFCMRITNAYYKKFGSANCAMRGVSVS